MIENLLQRKGTATSEMGATASEMEAAVCWVVGRVSEVRRWDRVTSGSGMEEVQDVVGREIFFRDILGTTASSTVSLLSAD